MVKMAGGSAANDRDESKQDRGVSPVIGVVLMIAVTVILAGVVASLVIPMAGGVQDGGPMVSFEYTDNTDDTVTIRHTSGEKIDHERLTIKVAGSAAPDGEQFGSDVTAGDSTDVTATSGDRIELIYETEDGETRIISEWEVP